MLRKNFLKEKLEAGKTVIGTWAIIPSTITIDIIASTGLDFIIIDAEHGPISFETAQEMAITCESREVSPVMRVVNINESDILKAMDIGVHCIQIPNVETKHDVLEIVKLAKYPPVGKRGFSPFTRAGNYSLESSTHLTQEANDNTLIAINIETKKAIENIDHIVQVEALDIIFVGLFDLSKALGIPGEVDNPQVLNYLAQLTRKINDAGKYPGTISTNYNTIQRFLSMGIKYLVHLVDCEMLRASYSEILKKFSEYKSV